MNIFVTGATGFIGQYLVRRLVSEGHQVTAFVRNPERASEILSEEVDLADGTEDLQQGVTRADAVINLAGEPLLGGRWTDEKLHSIRQSRLKLTRLIVDGMRDSDRPQVLVSASAVGFYGGTGDQPVTEQSSNGTGFLAELCRDWETEAFRARSTHTRVVALRIGIVLGSGGGALGKMLLPFRLGLGGPIGSGKQYVPWIHIHDLVQLICRATQDERFEGAFNATGPMPVPFSGFARALATQLRRPCVFPLPAFVVRLLFGEASSVLLEGQRAIPDRATNLGFEFKYKTVEQTLADIL